MSYIGDIPLGNTFNTKFCTVQSTGAPTTLSSSPVISNYVGNNTTELTAGITLTADFDSRTGLNNVAVVATSGNGYATATDNQLVITTGTVNSVSAVGYVVAEYSIENRSGLRPTTAGRTLDVAATGEAGLDFANINIYAAGPFAPTAVVDSGTAQSATGTTLVLRSAAAFADSELVGATVVIRSATAGAGQRRLITANVGSTDTITVDTWTTTPTGTIVYDIFGSAPGSTTAPAPVNAIQISGDATAADNAESFFDGTGYAGTNNVIPTVTSVTALAGNAGIKKNTALTAYPFLMTDSTNHAPATGLTVAATRSIDGAAFGACANAVSEIASGWYKITLATTDLNGNTIALKFTATGADQANHTIVTAP